MWGMVGAVDWVDWSAASVTPRTPTSGLKQMLEEGNEIAGAWRGKRQQRERSTFKGHMPLALKAHVRGICMLGICMLGSAAYLAT